MPPELRGHRTPFHLVRGGFATCPNRVPNCRDLSELSEQKRISRRLRTADATRTTRLRIHARRFDSSRGHSEGLNRTRTHGWPNRFGLLPALRLDQTGEVPSWARSPRIRGTGVEGLHPSCQVAQPWVEEKRSLETGASAASPASNPARTSATSGATTSGSNCDPEQRRSSSSAASTLIAWW